MERRRMLKSAASAGIIALAGCTGRSERLEGSSPTDTTPSPSESGSTTVDDSHSTTVHETTSDPESMDGSSRAWVTPRGDFLNTAWAPDDVSPDPTSLSHEWSYQTDTKRMFVPLVRENLVVASSKSPNGDVFGLDSKDSTDRWTSEDDSLLRTEPTFLSGSVFGLRGDSIEGVVEKIHGDLEAPSVEIGNGMKLRSVGDELIIGHAKSGMKQVEILGVEPGANQSNWKYEMFDIGDIVDIAIQGSIIYVGGNEYDENSDVLEGTGSVTAYNIDEQTVLWEQTESGDIEAIAVGDSNLFVIGPGIIAINKSSGEVVWRRELSWVGTSYPAVGPNRVYTAGKDQIIALNKSDGEKSWKESMNGISVRPSIGGETVFTVATRRGDSPSRFVALDKETGERLFETTFGQTAITAPAIANNAVFLGVDDGTVHKYS